MISKDLLEILACPKCKGPVQSDQDQTSLICRSCMLLYEIKDGIPVMLIDEAKALSEEDLP